PACAPPPSPWPGGPPPTAQRQGRRSRSGGAPAAHSRGPALGPAERPCRGNRGSAAGNRCPGWRRGWPDPWPPWVGVWTGATWAASLRRPSGLLGGYRQWRRNPPRAGAVLGI
ncbi:unnamed protein product, partial [Ectocarpus sp. 6 AP-2014]